MKVLTPLGQTCLFVLPLILAPALPLTAWSAEGDLLWARQVGGTRLDNGIGIAVDAAGNALVTGEFRGSATFGAGEDNETTLISAADTADMFIAPDIFIAQYAADGRLLWARQAGGTGYDRGSDIAVDAVGNALVAGEFRGSATFGPGEDNETTLYPTNDSYFDVFVARYAPDGHLLWARQAGGPFEDYASDIAVDAAGNATVSGFFTGTATFGHGEDNETTFTAAGRSDIFIAQYAPDGRLVWARQAGGPFGDDASGIAVDIAGNALVTGSFSGSATFGSGEDNETTLTAAGRSDIFIARYAPDGHLLWATQAGGGDDSSYGIAVDAAGNALATGTFSGSATFGSGEDNETTLTAGGGSDIFIAQYAPDGRLLWVKQAGGLASAYNYGYGHGIAVDAVGNALVTGLFGGSTTFGAGEANETTLETTRTADGDSDIFIAKYAGKPKLVVGGTVIGIAPGQFRCANHETQQRVRFKDNGATAWDCVAEGLVVQRGDRVWMGVQGVVTDAPSVQIAGELSGATLKRVKCYNVSTGAIVIDASVAGSRAWNCTAAGLEASPGDLIRIGTQERVVRQTLDARCPVSALSHRLGSVSHPVGWADTDDW